MELIKFLFFVFLNCILILPLSFSFYLSIYLHLYPFPLSVLFSCASQAGEVQGRLLKRTVGLASALPLLSPTF